MQAEPAATSFRVRTPCTECGQPIAADLPASPGATPGACPTCGVVQSHGVVPPARSGADQTGPRPFVRELRSQRRQVALLGALVLGLGAAMWRAFPSDQGERHAGHPERIEVGGPGRGYTKERPRRRVELAWRAVPRRHGSQVAEASPGGCSARVSLVSDGRTLVDAEFTLACGDHVVHSARTRDGLDCVAHEGPAIDAGAWEYDVVCRDRAGLDFDTRTRRARSIPIGPAVEVEFDIAREDGVRSTQPLFARSIGQPRWPGERRFRGQRIRPRKARAAARQEDCQVRVVPNASDEIPCRVLIRCGERIVYGGFAQGFADCTFGASGPLLATDDGPTRTDGDPILRLDVTGRRATVRDEDPAWTMELSLDPEPR